MRYIPHSNPLDNDPTRSNYGVLDDILLQGMCWNNTSETDVAYFIVTHANFDEDFNQWTYSVNDGAGWDCFIGHPEDFVVVPDFEYVIDALIAL